MNTRKTEQKLNNKGFSLIELLIAIGISAVVTTMVAGILSTTTQFHRMTTQQADVQTTNQQVASRLQGAIQEATSIYYYREASNGDFVLLLGNAYVASHDTPKNEQDSLATMFYYSAKQKTLFEKRNWNGDDDMSTLNSMMGRSGDEQAAPAISLAGAGTLIGVTDDKLGELTSEAKQYLVGTNIVGMTVRCLEVEDASLYTKSELSDDLYELSTQPTIRFSITSKMDQAPADLVTTTATPRNEVEQIYYHPVNK